MYIQFIKGEKIRKIDFKNKNKKYFSNLFADFKKFRNVANCVQDTDYHCNNNWYYYMHHPNLCHDKIFEKKNWKENES